MKGKETMLCILVTLGLTGIISWLFYQSLYGMAGAAVLFFPVKKTLNRYFEKRKKQELLYQFGEMLQMASVSLKAGYAIENAFREAHQEFVRLYGAKAAMAREFDRINRQVQLNVPLEQLIEELAEKTGIEEIISFSQVFGFAKRGGGDITKIFRNTVEKLRQKSEVEREIETVLSAKKMEQRIMNLVPFGILLYVGATSPEFLAPLYGNLMGAAIMTACLAGYVGAYLLSEKLLDIPV